MKAGTIYEKRKGDNYMNRRNGGERKKLQDPKERSPVCSKGHLERSSDFQAQSGKGDPTGSVSTENSKVPQFFKNRVMWS